MFISSTGPAPATGPATPYGSNAPPQSITGKSSAKEEFLEYARMTPAQKLRASVLSSMKLTEDDIKGMDPKERLQIEERIKELIKEKVEGDGAEQGAVQKGAFVDVTA